MASNARVFFRRLAVGGSGRFYCSKPSLSRPTFSKPAFFLDSSVLKCRLAPSFSHSGVRLAGGKRHYTSSSGKESDGEGENEGEDSEGEGDKKSSSEELEDSELEMLPGPRHHALAPVTVPETFPEVPLLPISRNPLFPRFVKMLEVKVCSCYVKCRKWCVFALPRYMTKNSSS